MPHGEQDILIFAVPSPLAVLLIVPADIVQSVAVPPLNNAQNLKSGVPLALPMKSADTRNAIGTFLKTTTVFSVCGTTNNFTFFKLFDSNLPFNYIKIHQKYFK